MFKSHRVEPGSRLRLRDVDAGATPGAKGGKQKTLQRLADLRDRLEEQQRMLWAEHRRKVLVVLQGMDTSGKDGTISHVFEAVNPMGVRVALFKQPTTEELACDFLWRVHKRVPGVGEMGIFNRSHYEDVLVVRVKDLVPKETWKSRYRQINDFERLLVETGTTVLKFFLHIDADEQKKRLEERLRDPTKRWKFSPSDLLDRKLWDRYMEAYEDAIRKCSTEEAPWYVVPSNKKWYRNLVVASVLVETLEGLGMKLPETPPELEKIQIE
jgi:PPK2 family polyphosphate:nucleotide phosphotransferase